MKISIVIPLFIYSDRFKQDFSEFLNLDYLDYEIIIISDNFVEFDNPLVKVVCTNQLQTGPAEKRDMALSYCEGEICAFIDDDAYPQKNWLKNAVSHFSDSKVAAVGGPGVTPDRDSFFEKAGGVVYSSVPGSGLNIYRFIPKKIREVDDYPAYNLLVRKNVLNEIGGFKSTFYGGEDTKLCLNIVKAGYKIIYDPSVIVYHHRRPLFIPHLKQIYNVGLHRGYFVKVFPETSLRFFYFLPLLFTIFVVIISIGALFNQVFALIFGAFISSFWLLCFLSMLLSGDNFRLAFFASIGVIATHIVYGTAFLRGLMTKKLER